MYLLQEDPRSVQGTPEWRAFRKLHITATDSGVITGVSPWKTKKQLYDEKICTIDFPSDTNWRMQRGIDLEPIARAYYEKKVNTQFTPKIAVKEWAMASLDGVSDSGEIVEIKCPGNLAHNLALSGKIPDYYYPQLQHQMHVCEVDKMDYFSFDGNDGVIVEVVRNDEYIKNMIEKELEFYMCLKNKTPPTEEEKYIERQDEIWENLSYRWKSIKKRKKEIEDEEEAIRQELMKESGKVNTQGFGLSFANIVRKGNVDYSKIPNLIGVDLEQYRKPSSTSWRIS